MRAMFLATALLYPLALALLCLGAGLLIDRLSGRWLPAALMPAVGAAALIALSQLTTYAYPLAPATPYLMGASALAGFVLGHARARELALRLRHRPWLLLLPLAAYMVALAPVLVDGRASFSSFMVLTDSAVHMLGASFLLSHGQHYVHLDLRNSYGEYVNDYYNTSYPSGADTLYGGSALLLGLKLIWAFQPFNAFVLALASGPAWLIARRMGLDGVWSALAALSATVPALVYAYELFGSIKEITALPMILTLGCLVCLHRRWLGEQSARAVLPLALVLAAGVSALGVAFGAWALVAALALALPLARELVRRARRALLPLLLALGTLALAALPTWADLPGSVSVARGIAATTNPGNLKHPLRAIQVFGVWLGGSFQLEPVGGALTATYALVYVTLLAATLGIWQLLRRRELALLGWIALSLLAWLVVAQSVTTWGAAKTLMITSPVVMLLAWAGVGALRRLRSWPLALPAPALLALALTGGPLASDAMQYHVTGLAPTARYEALASLELRFAREGPTLFTDFDEYSMYELPQMDVGGPDFIYPPPAVETASGTNGGGHGLPVELTRLAPARLRSYPLIVTRRDPAQARPPAEYALIWQDPYYQVWRRRAGARSALAQVALAGEGSAAQQCARLARLAARAPRGAGMLTAARSPQLVRIALNRSPHPRRWGHEHGGLVMSSPGTLHATFELPRGGRWLVWMQGQIMPTVELRLDGRALASVSGQLDGNSLVPDTVPAVEVQAGAGKHRIAVVRRGGEPLAPGEGGPAVLDAVFLTPASEPAGGRLVTLPAPRWRELCRGGYEWAELFPGTAGAR